MPILKGKTLAFGVLGLRRDRAGNSEELSKGGGAFGEGELSGEGESLKRWWEGGMVCGCRPSVAVGYPSAYGLPAIVLEGRWVD